PALLDATVKASLGFAGRRVTGAAVASAASTHLARGVLHAMTLSKLKVLGASMLASVLAVGGTQGLAFQFGGLGVPRAEESKGQAAREGTLARSVERLRAQLDRADRRNAELRKELEEVRAELKALRADPKAVETTRQSTTQRHSEIQKAFTPKGI